MKRILLAIVMLVVVQTGNTEASVLSSALKFDGSTEFLQDDSVGHFVKRNDDPENDFDPEILQVGDLIQGIINISDVNVTEIGSGQTIWGVYSMRVDTIDYTTGRVTFGGLDDTDDQSMYELLKTAGFDPDGLFSTGDAGDSAVAFISMAADASLTDSADVDGTTFGTALGGLGGIAPGDGWVLDMFGGFKDGGEDFYQMDLKQDSPDTVANPATTPGFYDFTIFDDIAAQTAEVNGPFSFPPSAAFTTALRGGFSVFGSSWGSGTVFLPIVAKDIDQVEHDTTVFVGGTDAAIGTANLAELANGWTYGDDGDVFFQVVPEPSSLLILSGLVAIGAFFVRRKKS